MGDKYRQKNPKSRKTKYRLVFDEESRTDFLTGFHKRKLDRKKFHQKKLEERQKEEIRQMKRDKKKAMDEAFNIILKFPDEEAENTITTTLKVHDLPDHTVTVTSITDVDLLAEHGGLGENKVEYDSESSEDEKKDEEEDNFGFPAIWNETADTQNKSESSVPIEEKPETKFIKKKCTPKQRGNKKPKKPANPSSMLHKKKRKFSTKRKHHLRKK